MTAVLRVILLDLPAFVIVLSGRCFDNLLEFEFPFLPVFQVDCPVSVSAESSSFLISGNLILERKRVNMNK